MARIIADTIDTPDGPFTIIENELGEVVASGWTADPAVLARHARIGTDLHAGRARAASAATGFYDGELTAIDAVAVAQTGTELQRTVWDALRDITPGHPETYGSLAAALGRPTAFRAIASACARNTAALFVPCHRVIATNGGLAGFAWGVEVKRSLLDHEAAGAGR